jgi:hypothetical protein
VVARDEGDRQPEPVVEPEQVILDVGRLTDVAAEEDGVTLLAADVAAQTGEVVALDEIQVEVRQPDQSLHGTPSPPGPRRHRPGLGAAWAGPRLYAPSEANGTIELGRPPGCLAPRADGTERVGLWRHPR